MEVIELAPKQRFPPEYRIHDPKEGVKYGQVFVWWQALSGAAQVALVVILAGTLMPRTAYAIYTWSVIHHPVDKRLSGEVPFTVAMVDLEEGPRVVGRLVNADRAKIKAGMPVKARYEDMDKELTLLNFEPA